MHSADYAVVRCLCLSLCPPVFLFALSIPGRYSMAKYIIQLFHRQVGTPFCFSIETVWQYSDGNPLTGASNAMFGQSRFISEIIHPSIY